MCNATRFLLMRCVTGAVIAAACAGVSDPVAGQVVNSATEPSRAALALRIDSLAERVRELGAIVQRRDSTLTAPAAALRTDTARVGPFLLVSRRTAPPGLVAALTAEWESRAAMVGGAGARLDGIIISHGVDRSELESAAVAARFYPIQIHANGMRADYSEAARRAVTDILIGELPADVRAWLRAAGLAGRDPHQWAYRSLALSEHPLLRGCFEGDTHACVTVLTDTAALDAPASVLGSALHHALERGGAGAYARLVTDAPDMETRLERAAVASIEDLAADWRRVLQAERPRVHAGVARAGFWTLVWLCGLGIIATRSTRWRLG